MFSGQAAAQSLIAAGLSIDAGWLPHSLHSYFVRRSDSAKPTQFQVDRDRDGRSFSARRVLARQNGEVIFSMSASFAVPASARRSFPDEEAEPVSDMSPVDSLVFCGPSGVPLRRSNFGKMSGWPYAVPRSARKAWTSTAFDTPATPSPPLGGAGIKDLMARMGLDSERAALIYQHQARGADKIITSNIDAHVEAERGRKDDDDGTAGVLVPVG